MQIEKNAINSFEKKSKKSLKTTIPFFKNNQLDYAELLLDRLIIISL